MVDILLVEYFRNARELDVDDRLKGQLEQFHSIEDFKVLYPPVSGNSFDTEIILKYCCHRMSWVVRGPGSPASAQATVSAG